MTLMAAASETLYEHIDEALRFFYHEGFIPRGYGTFITSKLKLQGQEVDEKSAKDLVGLAILLHDVGKAHSLYQKAIERYEREGVWRSRIVHELYSVAVAQRVLILNEEAKRLVMTAILLHHEYMRLPNSSMVDEPFKADIEELKRVIMELSLRYGLSEHLKLSEIRMLSKHEVRSVVKSLVAQIKVDRRLYACAALILHPLIICDNISAHRHRRDRIPRILEDVDVLKDEEKAYDILRGVFGNHG